MLKTNKAQNKLMTADLLRRQMRNYLNFRLSFDYCVGNVDMKSGHL